jgi:hypothetical protein
MDFIQERREHTLAENNTAQSSLLDILDASLPSISDLIIKTPLYGELDFEVLGKCNFKNITAILLPPGEVTGIRNLPEGISKLVCGENLLIELTNLPKSLQVLEVPRNAIRHIDFTTLPNLLKIDIAFNYLEVIENLNKNIESILCDNNQIKRIDLAGTDNLNILHCSNNGLLHIENMSDSISDFKMENNPMIEIKYRNQFENENAHELHESYGIEYSDALIKYFKWKNDYETKRKDQKKKVYKRFLGKGNRKRAQKEAMAVKTQCINCKRHVGMIFKCVDNHFIGQCGDSSNRCLDVKLYKGEHLNINYLINEYKSLEEYMKEEIIKLKYDTLFNYITESESTKKFKDEIEEYNLSMELIKEFTDKYENIYFNEEKKEKLQKKKIEISEIRNHMNDLYKKYCIEQNPEVLKTILQMHNEELIPNIDIERRLKYDIVEMDLYDNGLSILVQKPASISQIDYLNGEMPKVVKWTKKSII